MPKSPGVAALLSLLWLGAGHLYANQLVIGVPLVLANGILVILSFTVLGLVVAVPLWFLSAALVIPLSAVAANQFNRRNGLVIR